LKKKLRYIDYYFITDPRLSRKGIASDVACALRAGCRIVQYREKEKSAKDMIDEASRIKGICGNKALFLINDRVDVALAVDADGVHLGQEDMDLKTARKLLGEKKVIGITVHTLEEALKAENDGADYVAVSPIYTTGTKTDAGKACGTGMIEKIRGGIKLPIVAIGGIGKKNAPDAIRAGADSVAAISAVLCSDDVEKEVGEFVASIKRSRTG